MISSKTQEWIAKPLGELVEFLDSLRIPIKASDRAKRRGTIPYYGANGQVDLIDDYLFDEPLILLAEDGGFFGSKERPIAYKVEGKSWVNNHAHVLRPKKGIDIDYLHWILSYYNVMPFLSGSTRFKLTKSDAARIPIVYPINIEEQKRIALILNKADSLKEKRQRANHVASKLLRSVFLKMFGDPSSNPKKWKQVTVESVSREIIDCPHSTPTYEDSGIPLIRTTNIKKGYLDFGTTKFVSIEEHKKRLRRICPLKGDILYAREATFGNAALVGADMEFSVGQRIMLIRPDQSLVKSEFLVWMINSDFVYNQAKQMARGATNPHVNVGDVKKFKIILPPIEQQEAFSSVFEKVDIITNKQNESSKWFSELFNSLMSKAFKGAF